MESKKNPYVEFGRALKAIRTRFDETIEDVSGAVELMPEDIAGYEAGKKRPSEDILDLLITHFSVKETEAIKLWKLAGYDIPRDIEGTDEPAVFPQPVVIIPLDNRIMYSDSVNVMINDKGVVMNFMQNSGAPGKKLSAAKIGMSLKQAKKVLEVLDKSIEAASSHNSQNKLPESGEE